LYGIFTVSNFDETVKSQGLVMPDLIRQPEHNEYTGFRLSPEGRKEAVIDFLQKNIIQ
jgi:hypothetical protein